MAKEKAVKAIKAPVVPSSSRDLIPVGPRHVSTKHSGKRDENGERPTTTRALILRNGKYGAMGTGELVQVNRISGREKLDLLAEDLIEKEKKAIMRPFKLDQCLKIAESQFNAFLDEISNLQDAEFFYDQITKEVEARKAPSPNSPDPFRDLSFIATVIATRIHNAYTLASAWKLVLDHLRDLEEVGLDHKSIRSQLKNNSNLRSRYLALFDIINVLVDTSQTKFSVLATTTPHYAQFFKQTQTNEDNSEVMFDWGALRAACKSFLDSIIIELCFPRGSYPKRILYHILHDAIDEAPREAKRFPQTLWDAVGDLSVILELQELIEAPLLGPEGEVLKSQPREMPEQYEQWVDAQLYSEEASKMTTNFKPLIHPLTKTKDAHTLKALWKCINSNYESVSGMDIDALWQLSDARDRIPQWHANYTPSHKVSDSDSESDVPHHIKTSKKKGGNKARMLTLTNDSDSEGSMPSLRSVSNSSDEESEDQSDSDNSEDEEDNDDESGYDTEEEDEMRELLREAMDTAAMIPEFYEPNVPAPEFAELAEERKGNPFLKLLGSLRGRVFTSNPKLKPTGRAQPRRPFLSQSGTSKTTQRSTGVAPGPSPTPRAPRKPQTTEPSEEGQSHKVTIEEVEDEDDDSAVRPAKKKKPKKKKKKKPASAVPAEGAESPALSPTISPAKVSTPTSPPKLNSSQTSKPPTKPSTPPKKQPSSAPISPAAAVRSPPTNQPTKTANSLYSSSTVTLPIGQTTAQSARTYVQELDAPKSKVKSRPDHASIFSGAVQKRGIFSRKGGKDKDVIDASEVKSNVQSVFKNLRKKAADGMHQILGTRQDLARGTKPMKWDKFLTVMREMGFRYDPSTAGSSVRFDPPDSRNTPITFHKPHPDSTIPPLMLKDYSKRLKEHYGWNEEDFLSAMEKD